MHVTHTSKGLPESGYIPRLNTGALFEPTDTVLHGAGQSPEAFLNYSTALGAERHPSVYMVYQGLKGVNPARLDKMVEYHRRHPGFVMYPQIGLSMTSDGSPELRYEHLVADGEHDAQIDEFLLFMKAYGEPVFLRLGYEFNGHWNGYVAEDFVRAWKRFAERMRKLEVNNIALVWCFAADGTNKDFMSFYPGDDYVDWWSIDLFSVEHLTAAHTFEFLDAAVRHNKPVMIGESTARRVGVHAGEDSWEIWFKPYFHLIRARPEIKAFCYINWNWASYPQWHDWGDSRIEENEIVLNLYKDEMDLPLYQHARQSGSN